MGRSLVMSLLLIGSMALAVGGATFAPFTGSDSATGTVTAGTIDIIFGGGDEFDLIFYEPGPTAGEHDSAANGGTHCDGSVPGNDYHGLTVSASGIVFPPPFGHQPPGFPGDTYGDYVDWCTGEIGFENNSSWNVRIRVDATMWTSDDGPDDIACPFWMMKLDGVSTWFPVGGPYSLPDYTTLGVGDSNGYIKVWVGLPEDPAGDENVCQGDKASVEITITATQAPGPPSP